MPAAPICARPAPSCAYSCSGRERSRTRGRNTRCRRRNRLGRCPRQRCMRNVIRAGLGMLALAGTTVAAAGCASAPSTPGPAPALVVARGVAAIELAADPRPLGAADTALGLDVLRAWCAQYPRQNLVFSPSTLASALGMAYLGARGATARVMARVLHLPARRATAGPMGGTGPPG